MNIGESYAGRMDWITKNIVNNLDFVPDDKLNWKPAPTASSALEIVEHLVAVVTFMTARVRGQEAEFSAPQFATRDAAKSALQNAAREYSQAVLGASETDWKRAVAMPFGKVDVAMLAEIAISDSTHHHGQIAYIQTLLGDTESHMIM